jgi:transcriptional regulator with XRE-family HTH domain
MNTAQLVRRARKRKGYTQAQFGQMVGYSANSISAIENRRASIPPEKIGIFAYRLGMPKKLLVAVATREIHERVDGMYEV